jgi:hypothetical protein
MTRRPLAHTSCDASSAPCENPRHILSWRQKRICPACEIIHEHERHALETILRSLHEAEFACRLVNSAALCIIHTMRVAEVDDAHPHLPLLIEMQGRKYAHLVEELEEFRRKHDHRFSHECWGAESDSWLRAIELLTGKPGVFGNDVHRKSLGFSVARWWIRLRDCCLRWVRGGSPDCASSRPLDSPEQTDGRPC